MKKFEDLCNLSDILLGPDGCPWDKKQTVFTLKKYVMEEALEVIQAIDNEDWENLKEELGDLLFNIIFTANLACINKKFNINEVISEVYQKIIRRHPHIFGDDKNNFKNLSAEDVKKNWDEIKKNEKVKR